MTPRDSISRFYATLAVAASLVTVAAVLATPANAAAQFDPAKSTLTAVSKQMGVSVEGRFTKFDAQIDFDPAKPAAGTARVTVDVGSYDLGDATYNDSVRGPDWFDAKTHPQATFVSTSIAPAGANQYRVTGQLTIRGHAETVVAPITVAQQGATQTFDGTLPIRRLAFGIGAGEWKDTSVVADEVQIRFHVVTQRQ